MYYLYKRSLIVLICIYFQSPHANMSRNSRNRAWHVGRVPPSKFEYDKLNGFYAPNRAKDLCEEDLQCGGFTFKGTRKSKDVKEIYFFHFIYDQTSSLEEYIKYPHWTTYIVPSRNYVVVSGFYLNKSDNSPSSRIETENWDCTMANKQKIDDFMKTIQDDIVAVAIKEERPSCGENGNRIPTNPSEDGNYCGRRQQIMGYKKFEFSDVHKYSKGSLNNDSSVIILRIRNVSKHQVSHNLPQIDRCCKSSGWDEDLKDLDKQLLANDLTERISCNISKKSFIKDYVMKRKVVILKNCSDSWEARKWTFKGLLSRYPTKLNVTWNAILRHKSTNYAGTWRQIPGHDILPLFSQNYTIKVWETLKASLKRRGMSKRMTLTLKMDLFDEYSYPIPLPNNIFLRLPKESPFPDLEYVILGQKGTGTPVHTDPEMTDAFNVLFVGHKWWVVLPKDIYELEHELSCDEKCSDVVMLGGENPKGELDKDITNIIWLKHILPQIRGRKFYGKMLYEAIQKPGETMYMPHLTGHAVYNLDETVAATGNPYYSTAIDESAFELFDKKMNWFARDNGSDIIIFDEVFKDHERKRFYDTMTQVKPTARYVKMSKTDIYSNNV